MKNFLLVALFTAGISFSYTGIAYFLPRLENRPPRVLNWGEQLTTEELVGAGAEVFEANCVQCHKLGQPGGRCPDLGTIGARAGGQAQLAGSGGDDADYLLQALCDPGAYLAEGYGNIMPAQGKLLSGPQMLAVVAFMQEQGGTVSVSVSDAAKGRARLEKNGCGAAGGAAAAPAVAAAPLGPPEDLFNEFGCSGCHFTDKPDRSVGPSLQDVGSRLSWRELYESLVAPDAKLTAGFPAGLMKATLDGNGFYERMTPADYQALVDWLSDLQG